VGSKGFICINQSTRLAAAKAAKFLIYTNSVFCEAVTFFLRIVWAWLHFRWACCCKIIVRHQTLAKKTNASQMIITCFCAKKGRVVKQSVPRHYSAIGAYSGEQNKEHLCVRRVL
jgi:hypothetical protein